MVPVAGYDFVFRSSHDVATVTVSGNNSISASFPVSFTVGDREKIKLVYGRDGRLETLNSKLVNKDGKWYITFAAVHFSPHALIVSTCSLSLTQKQGDVHIASLASSRETTNTPTSLNFGH